MKNKKLIAGIAAGAAVVAGAAVFIARTRASKKYQAHVEEAKANFKSKLDELQHKAEKEFSKGADSSQEAVNAAKERANKWVKNTAKA